MTVLHQGDGVIPGWQCCAGMTMFCLGSPLWRPDGMIWLENSRYRYGIFCWNN